MKTPTQKGPSVLDMRDEAVKMFQDHAARMVELRTEISAFDLVLSRMNPNHVKFDFATMKMEEPKVLLEDGSTPNHKAEAAKVVSDEPKRGRPAKTKAKLSKKAAAARSVSSGAAQAETSGDVIAADTALKAKQSSKKAASKAKQPSAASKKAAAEIVTEARAVSEEQAARDTLNAYFSGKRPQDEISNILRAFKVPASMDTIAQHFRSIHAIDLTKNPKLPTLFKTRLQAQIAHMMKKGLVAGQTIADPSGKEVKHYSLVKSKAKTPKAAKTADAAEEATATDTPTPEAGAADADVHNAA